ncbi:L,D-transpeptidase family protein [Candidatus Saccharibacteria bacterium]|nr:L,D-transpeptidase family protein [Candidatus Saccharibacteria bacterium]
MGEKNETQASAADSSDSIDESVAEVVESPVDDAPKFSVKAKTHSKKRTNKASKLQPQKTRKAYVPRIVGISAGIGAVVAIVISGVLGQFYKDKTLPNVYVAGQKMSGKTEQQIKDDLTTRTKKLNITLKSGDKVLKPSLKEIGYTVDQKATVTAALEAKRDVGLISRLQFWHKVDVPAVVSINDTLINQYVETNIPEILNPPTDATLAFNARTQAFDITNQAAGQGADMISLKAELSMLGKTFKPHPIDVTVAEKGPNITEAELAAILDTANEIVGRRITLTGLGYTYTARASDIAEWITPTPKEGGGVKLVVDPAKIQSYVETISKRISSSPVDTKVLVDEATGQQVVLQQGRDGTELADQEQLANAIANSIAKGEDITQQMNIKVAAHKTVNMSSYDKWIEVDLSEQRTTAYERATPVNSFIIASGTAGHETVKGEFEIWLRVRSQTMQGGSKADGSYYSIPNVEWVSYFYQDYALHGAWWREKFGYPASHGCVNMRNEDARWVYEWAPLGTKVIVHD